jgi:hypothetical protein
MYRTVYHRDGSVTYWSVHQQRWMRRAHYVPDADLAAMSERERQRVLRNLRWLATRDDD